MQPDDISYMVLAKALNLVDTQYVGIWQAALQQCVSACEKDQS